MRRILLLFSIVLAAQAAEPDRVERLLAELSEAYGPIGFEGPVRAIMRRELTPYAARFETDGLGSLIAVAPASDAAAPRLMLAAHMDELSLLVKHITPEGFVKFLPVGGWLDLALVNQRFVILTRKGPVTGVCALKTPHIMSSEERSRIPRRDNLFIDVGATSRQDAEERLGIRPGDPVAPQSRFEKLKGGNLYLGKAWDDRAGLAVIVEVMRRLKQTPAPCSVYAVATVQEEVGVRGAKTASYLAKPDIGINLEGGVAADHPGITADEAQERIGGGPGMFLHDSFMLPNVKLRDFILDTAKAKGIPVQFEILSGYGEDGAEMQRAYGGAPSINLTVPTRYMHNHNGIISRADFDRTVDLVTEVIRRMDPATVKQLKAFD
jgi:endoglucanase